LKAIPDYKTRWPWLAEVNGDFPQNSVLYELGRVPDPKAIHWLADQLCTGQFTAVEVVRRIRAWRLDHAIFPPAASDTLAAVLLKTVENYAVTHKGLTLAITVDAMNLVLGMLQKQPGR
jgi:hypothetical protein